MSFDEEEGPGATVPLARDPKPTPEPSDLPARYQLIKILGIGTTGEVLQVHDTHLDRFCAMKVLHGHLLEDTDARARLDAEIAHLGALQHPGVVTVHERGELRDGRPWFTMVEVSGRTLKRALKAFRELPAGEHSVALRRLVEALRSVAATIAFAHSRNVVHRDLKPDNIMQGAFGEVIVVDWGLGRSVRPDSPSEDDIAGTPGYMAPEQLHPHGRPSPAWDIYALGAMLYEVLAGRPPYVGSLVAVQRAMDESGPIPLREALAVGRVDEVEGLITLAEHAMAPDPAMRLDDAAAFADGLQAWLDGEIQRAQALEYMRTAQASEREAREQRKSARAHEEEAKRLLEGVPQHAGVEKKEPGWAAKERADQAFRSAALHDARREQNLHAALRTAPTLAEARSELARLYREALIDAEARNDADASARLLLLLRDALGGQDDDWLEGRAHLSLPLAAEAARFTVAPFEERDWYLQPGSPRPVEPDAQGRLSFARGSQLLTIEAPGHATTRYPVHLARGEHQTPPEGEPPLTLPADGELEPDECFVPAGWAQIGSATEGVEPLRLQSVYLRSFVIQRVPVTLGEWKRYLAALPEPEREAMQIQVRARRGLTGADDEAVVGVDWNQAGAYAAWWAERTGQPWRLPHEVEWEKAARGVDGRLYCWGNRPEVTWACVSGHAEGEPILGPVGRFPRDESPYGVRDMVGGVRNWCADTYERQRHFPRQIFVPSAASSTATDYRMLRGGCYLSGMQLCALSSRFAAYPHETFSNVGFRLARSYP